MNDESVSRAIRADYAWGAAREAYGRAKAFAEIDPSKANLAAKAAATADVERTFADFNTTLKVAGFGPMPGDGFEV